MDKQPLGQAIRVPNEIGNHKAIRAKRGVLKLLGFAQ